MVCRRQGSMPRVHLFLLLALVACTEGSQLPISDQNTEKNSHNHPAIGKQPARDTLGLLITVVVGAIASAAGVGGGEVFVPAYGFILDFGLKGGTALSQVAIAGGGLAGAIFVLSQSHPEDHSSPLIQLKLVTMLMPILLVGTSVGVLLNGILPDYLITILFILALLYMVYHTGEKALSKTKEERAKKRERKSEEASSNVSGELKGGKPNGATKTESKKKMSSGSKVQDIEANVPAAHEGPTGTGQHEEGPADSSSDHTGDEGKAPGVWDPLHGHASGPNAKRSYLQMAILMGAYGGFLTLQLLKSAWTRCTIVYWVLWGLLLAYGLGMSGLLIWQTFRTYMRDAGAHFHDHDKTVKLTPAADPKSPRALLRTLLIGAGVTISAGLVAGLLGLGGGFFLNPLLLALGVKTEATTATSNTLVFLSAVTAAGSFALEGQLALDFSLILGFVCFAASVIGVVGIAKVVEKSGRQSLLLWLVWLIMLLGLILTLAMGLKRAVDDLSTGHKTAFTNVCAPPP